MAERSRRLWRNTLTYIGSGLVGLSLISIFQLLFFELISPEPNPYIGLLSFLVLPVILILGALITVVGMLLKRWRIKRSGGELASVEYYPHIDLRLPTHRRIVMILAGVTAVAVPFVAVMSYEGYHYTDSNDFCGGVCHAVMHPQHVAHQRSPHSRVECATCHIGRGASWYVKSKLSGLRQVWAVTRNSYPRPIPSAIKELRPARETCEQCHWPQKSYGDQLITINHFADDEANTPRPIQMMMKTGGNDPTTAPPSGIHWHMALGHSIEFIATDDALQEIPWIRATDQATNTQRVYRSDGLTSADPPPEGEQRLMDCMSCHNRATHIIREPWRAADDALQADPALASLPYAKREIIKAVVKPRATKELGLHEVATEIEDFYLMRYPEIASQRRPELDRLIAATRNIYELISFPEMNVTWRTYPDNIGHKTFPGCFRCHAGDHVDDNGRQVSHECATCHTFLTPSENASNGASLIREGDFVHPVEFEGRHATMRCDFCHDGGAAPSEECAECHVIQAGYFAGTLEAFAGFEIEADLMDGMVDCMDCHTSLSEPISVAAINRACLECHDAEDGYGGMVTAWKKEVDDLLKRATASATSEQQSTLEALLEAGPLHNIEATRKILTAIGGEGFGQAEAAEEASLPTPVEEGVGR